jgi:hypothetical protein
VGSAQRSVSSSRQGSHQGLDMAQWAGQLQLHLQQQQQ